MQTRVWFCNIMARSLRECRCEIGSNLCGRAVLGALDWTTREGDRGEVCFSLGNESEKSSSQLPTRWKVSNSAGEGRRRRHLSAWACVGERRSGGDGRQTSTNGRSAGLKRCLLADNPHLQEVIYSRFLSPLPTIAAPRSFDLWRTVSSCLAVPALQQS